MKAWQFYAIHKMATAWREAEESSKTDVQNDQEKQKLHCLVREKKFPLHSHEQSPLSSLDMQHWKFQERNHHLLLLTVCSNYIYVINERGDYKKTLQFAQEIVSFLLPCNTTREPDWFCLNSALGNFGIILIAESGSCKQPSTHTVTVPY